MAIRPNLMKIGGKVVSGPLARGTGTQPSGGLISKPTPVGRPIPSGTKPTGAKPNINLPIKPGTIRKPTPIRKPLNIHTAQGVQGIAQRALEKRISAQGRTGTLRRGKMRTLKKFENQ